jgi:hypothetical protein
MVERHYKDLVSVQDRVAFAKENFACV